MKKRIGIIGSSGKWGAKLLSKLYEIQHDQQGKYSASQDNIEIIPIHIPSIYRNSKQIKAFDFSKYRLDLVIIATPKESHYYLANECLINGIDVFLEKPACGNSDELIKLINTSKNFNAKLYIDDVFIYHDPCWELGRPKNYLNGLIYIKDADLNPFRGKPKKINCTWGKYGTFKDDIYSSLLYHDINLLLYLGVPESLFNDKNLNINTQKINQLHIGWEEAQLKVEISIDRENSKNSYKDISLFMSNNNSYLYYDFKNPTNSDPLKSMLMWVIFDTHSRDQITNNNIRALNTLLIIENIKKNKMSQTPFYTKSPPPKIAVIGAGAFGCTVATVLASQGYAIDLFEKRSDIMQGVSSRNQFRIHRGYHYPRSETTALACRNSSEGFERLFSQAIIEDTDQYYAIDVDSTLNQTTPETYMKFMDDMELDYELIKSSEYTKMFRANTLNRDNIWKVDENLFSPHIMKNILIGYLNNHNVNILLETYFDYDKQHKNYDFIVNCTYEHTNELRDNPLHLQYELVEKPIIELGYTFRNRGIVVMDGPFTCIDPFLNEFHVVGNVTKAIHETFISSQKTNLYNILDLTKVKYSQADSPIIYDKGFLSQHSLIEDFYVDLNKYFNTPEDIPHIGSMFSIRTVLAGRDFDDARPTMVSQEDNRIHVFSGKIVTCVEAAFDVLKKIEQHAPILANS